MSPKHGPGDARLLGCRLARVQRNAKIFAVHIGKHRFERRDHRLLHNHSLHRKVGYKEMSAIASAIHTEIIEGAAVVPRMQPEDDVVVTLQMNAWAFIRERARQPMSWVRNENDEERRERRIVHDQIANLITRHIP